MEPKEIRQRTDYRIFRVFLPVQIAVGSLWIRWAVQEWDSGSDGFLDFTPLLTRMSLVLGALAILTALLSIWWSTRHLFRAGTSSVFYALLSTFTSPFVAAQWVAGGAIRIVIGVFVFAISLVWLWSCDRVMDLDPTLTPERSSDP